MAIKSAKGYKKKADDLFSEIIRSQGECEAMGQNEITCSPQLQCAHIITRKRAVVRTDTRNAFCLCAAHHRFYTDYPREFSRFITQTWAQDYYETTLPISRIPTKVDWQKRVDFLSDIKTRIAQGEITLADARQYED